MSDDLVKRLRKRAHEPIACTPFNILMESAERIEELEAACWRMQEERNRAVEWRDSDKNRAEKAEAQLEKAIIEGMMIAATVPIDQVPEAIKSTIAELTGGKDE